jgi:hypothetical protein
MCPKVTGSNVSALREAIGPTRRLGFDVSALGAHSLAEPADNAYPHMGSQHRAI